MNVYQKLIASATGLTDLKKIHQIEQYMRQIYFRSSLGWQSEPILKKAARESAADLECSGWNFK